MFSGFKNKRNQERQAATLYVCAVEESRKPVFYADWGVPDTVDGRFDLISLHVFLVLYRLKSDPESPDGLSQKLFDAMFADMDRALREMGAGDLGVGKRVKAMATAFYGRIAAYERGLAGDEATLADAIFRNIFRGEAGSEEHAAKLAGYIRFQNTHLAAKSVDDLIAGTDLFKKYDG